MNIFTPKYTPAKGFTLIELLVVIAIIGILVSIATVSFQQSRAQARDDVRQVNLKQLQLAIEKYNAQNGEYPTGCRGDDIWSGNLGTQWQCPDDREDYIVGLVPDYIDELPVEPNIDETTGYIYHVKVDSSGNRTGYKVMAHNAAEVKLVGSYDDEFARCPEPVDSSAACPTSPNPLHYAVYNYVGRNW